MRLKPRLRAHEVGAQVFNLSRPADECCEPCLVPSRKRKARLNEGSTAAAAEIEEPSPKRSLCCQRPKPLVGTSSAGQSSADAARKPSKRQDNRTTSAEPVTHLLQHVQMQSMPSGSASSAGQTDQQNAGVDQGDQSSDHAAEDQAAQSADICVGRLESYRHASGSAKEVTVAPDGSCSVPLEHKLSHQPSTPRAGTTWNNFWLHIPSNLARCCFKHPPCDVDVLITIDGKQYKEATRERYPVKASIKKRPGRSEYYMAGCSPLLSLYQVHVVTQIAVNRSRDQLTLHLQSPEQQRAAAAGEQQQLAAAVSTARADAAASGISGWQECKGTKKVINGNAKRSLLRIPAALVTRVFPTPLPSKFKVELSVYKDNQLIGVRPDATMTPDRAVGSSSYSVLLNEFLQQQLAGCAVIYHRAAPPAYLQVCFSSTSSAPTAAQSSRQGDNKGKECQLSPAAVANEGGLPEAAADTQQQQQQTLEQQAQQVHQQHIELQQMHSEDKGERTHINQEAGDKSCCKWFPWAVKQEVMTPAAAGSSSSQSVAGSMNRLGGIQRNAGLLTAGEPVLVKQRVSC